MDAGVDYSQYKKELVQLDPFHEVETIHFDSSQHYLCHQMILDPEGPGVLLLSNNWKAAESGAGFDS